MKSAKIKNVDVNPNLIRHVVFNSLRGYRQKFTREYGELIICVDNRTYWRKSFFPNYKANRKKDRDSSGVDWKLILDTMDTIKADLVENFPYVVMDVKGAEADDVIGVLSRKYHSAGKVLILSGDKDFAQLQKYPNVAQFAPVQNKWIKVEDPKTVMKVHIMKGDKGDGIPNFLSADDVFVRDDARQKSIRTERLELWRTMEPEQFCTTQMLRGYKRNEALIDLEKIPPNIQVDILTIFDEYKPHNRSRIFNYFVQNRMKLLMEHIGEF